MIDGLTDSSEDAFELDWDYDLPTELALPVRQFVEARTRRQTAERDYAAAQEQAIDALTAEHVSVRDAAELLGLSYQRVAQIRPQPAARRPPAESLSTSAGQLIQTRACTPGVAFPEAPVANLLATIEAVVPQPGW